MQIELYAPYIVMFIAFAIQYKLFMTPADFQKEKADFTQYISEHYISEKIYRDNHNSLEEQMRERDKKIAASMAQFDKKIDDIREILFEIAQSKVK